jgi:hypothetical protein
MKINNINKDMRVTNKKKKKKKKIKNVLMRRTNDLQYLQ